MAKHAKHSDVDINWDDDFQTPNAADKPEPQQRATHAAKGAKDQPPSAPEPAPAPVRAGVRQGPRNKIEDRLRAQAALDNPDIFYGLTPTGTNCPDPDDVKSRNRARAKQRARTEYQGEVIPGSNGGLLRENWKNIVAVVAVIVVLVIVVCVVRVSVSMALDDLFTITDDTAYVSPYDWTKLDRTNGRYQYVVDGQRQSRLGVDVSENQRAINWTAVANDGIDFAMIRLGYRGSTEGGLYLDSYYQNNLAQAKSAGLDVGVYFYSQATTVEEAVEEAQFVLQNLGGASLQYPVAFDSEKTNDGRTVGLSKDELDAICKAFCDTIEAAGYRTIVYGNRSDIARYHLSSIESRGIWWAEYGVTAPSATTDILMWQYSNGGSVAGIDAAVDMTIDMTQAYAIAKS